jgi:hypothetical protein
MRASLLLFLNCLFVATLVLVPLPASAIIPSLHRVTSFYSIPTVEDEEDTRHLLASHPPEPPLDPQGNRDVMATRRNSQLLRLMMYKRHYQTFNGRHVDDRNELETKPANLVAAGGKDHNDGGAGHAEGEREAPTHDQHGDDYAPGARGVHGNHRRSLKGASVTLHDPVNLNDTNNNDNDTNTNNDINNTMQSVVALIAGSAKFLAMTPAAMSTLY